MSELNLLPLEALPDGALLLRAGRVTALNAAAQKILPQLAVGQPLPPLLSGLEGAAGGSFTQDGVLYDLRITPLDGESRLFLFRSPPQTALTPDQLEGTLRQLRQLMSGFLLDCGQEASPLFRKNFHRMFRLTGNLEFLLDAQREELPFHPVTMDLAGLCRQIAREAGDLLSRCSIDLRCEEDHTSLLLHGDPQLLRRAILELMANAARITGEHRLTLRLRQRRDRALVLLSGGTADPSPRQLCAMLQPEHGAQLPLADMGAGLGMPIVRQITALHGGALLVLQGDAAPTVALALPMGPADTRLSVESPHIQTDGGLDPTLVALSDLLPAEVFREIDFD